METVATCSMTDGNGSYHGLALSFFEEMTRCRRQKHCRQRPDNPSGTSKFRKYHVYLPHLRLCDRDCYSVADGSGSCHAPAVSRTIVFRRDDMLPKSRTSLGMTRQPKRSIEIPQFRFVYVYTIATDAPAPAPRLMAAFADRSNGRCPRQKHRRQLYRSKFRKYAN